MTLPNNLLTKTFLPTKTCLKNLPLQKYIHFKLHNQNISLVRSWFIQCLHWFHWIGLTVFHYEDHEIRGVLVKIKEG